MPITTYILCDRPLPTLPVWQGALDGYKPHLVIEPGLQPSVHSGGWPSRLDSRNTGFELYQLKFGGLERLGHQAAGNHIWRYGVQLSYGPHPDEIIATTLAAVSLAAECKGVVIDDDGKVYHQGDLAPYLNTTLELRRISMR